ADPTVSTSSVSVLSTMSVASVSSTRAYISGLSASAALATGSARSSASGNTGPIIGGVLGGVTALLTIALFAFWWIRRTRSHTSSGRNEEGVTLWGEGYQDAAPKPPIITVSDEYRPISVTPPPRSPYISPDLTPATYHGLPEIDETRNRQNN
ncbi:hypothetical protein FRC06_003369, partial [Ceratobasidium sp. 370]